MYKYTVNQDLLQMDTNRPTRGHPFMLKKMYSKAECRHHFLSLRVFDSWNSLPVSVVTTPSLNCFKARLDRFWLAYMYSIGINHHLPSKMLKDKMTVDDGCMDQLTGPQAYISSCKG